VTTSIPFCLLVALQWGFLTSIYRHKFGFFVSVINQLDAQYFCFTISLFHASTCFEHMCPKHVEAWNKLIVKQKFCASSWLITEINIMRCTVSKTSKYKNKANFVVLLGLVSSSPQHIEIFWVVLMTVEIWKFLLR